MTIHYDLSKEDIVVFPLSEVYTRLVLKFGEPRFPYRDHSGLGRDHNPYSSSWEYNYTAGYPSEETAVEITFFNEEDEMLARLMI